MAAPGLPSAEIPRGAVVFVVNPRARHALPAAALADIFTEACHPFGLRAHVVETHSAEQARWLAAEAHRVDAAAIFAYGGDGALHTTMQGIPPGSPLPLGCIPAGTATSGPPKPPSPPPRWPPSAPNSTPSFSLPPGSTPDSPARPTASAASC